MTNHTTARLSKLRPWGAVALWFGVILLTIPFAREIQGRVDAVLQGRTLFAVALSLAALLLVFIIRIFKHDHDRKVGRILWMFSLASVTAWIVMFRLQATIEIVHFVEYGVLSVLFFYAWKKSIRSQQLFLVSVLCIGIASFLDEFIQWMVPGRYWDFRDIVLNGLSGAIAQLFLARVVLADKLPERSTPQTVRITCRLAWLNIAWLAFAFWNTPDRVASYASRVPILQSLMNSESVMAEYGYYHEDQGLGAFYSRMTMDELDLIDNERGESAGQIVARSLGTMEYMEFLKRYSPARDPFLHEFRVHLYRRNHYYATAWKYIEHDPGRYVHHMTVAFRENQILEEYFPVTLAASDQSFSSVVMEEIRDGVDWTRPYESPVSNHLIVGWTMLKCQMVFLVLAAGVGMIYMRYGKDE